MFISRQYEPELLAARHAMFSARTTVDTVVANWQHHRLTEINNIGADVIREEPLQTTLHHQFALCTLQNSLRYTHA